MNDPRQRTLARLRRMERIAAGVVLATLPGFVACDPVAPPPVCADVPIEDWASRVVVEGVRSSDEEGALVLLTVLLGDEEDWSLTTQPEPTGGDVVSVTQDRGRFDIVFRPDTGVKEARILVILGCGDAAALYSLNLTLDPAGADGDVVPVAVQAEE